MDYNGINAKISGMFGRLMARADYEALSRMRGVEEVGRYLAATPAYGGALASAGGGLRRGVIERRLMLSLYANYERLYKFITDASLRRFLDAYVLKHEVYALKLLLCAAYDGRDVAQDISETIPFPKYLGIDTQKLGAARSVDELIGGLAGTEFYPLLSRVYGEGSSLFGLESTLDIYYYRKLNDSINKYLNKKDAAAMRGIVGTETDLRNISWIYRLKTYYQVDSDLIYAHLIPDTYRLTRKNLRELASAESAEGFMAAVRGGPYGRGFSGGAPPDAVCERELTRLYSEARRRHARSPAAVVAYIYFNEQEIYNLTSLLEGVRYGLPPEEIMGFINVNGGGGIG